MKTNSALQKEIKLKLPFKQRVKFIIANEKSPTAFHPPLFAIFPVLAIYSSNIALIPFSDIWRPLAVVVGFSLGLWIIMALILRSVNRGATATSFICCTLFLYSHIGSAFPLLSQVHIWLSVVATIAVLLGLTLRATAVLNVAGLCLAVVSVGTIALGQVRTKEDESKIAHGLTQTAILSKTAPPDIFYIILDGYGRSDMLKRVMNFDNSPFIDGLKQRGFYVAAASHSNYVQTEISLSSSLNMDLISTLLPKQPRNTTDRAPFDVLITDNDVAHFLRSQGYRTVDITSGFPPVVFPNADLWLKHASGLSLFETSLIQMSPILKSRSGSGESQFLWRRQTLEAVFNNLGEMAAPTDRPKFVFAHVLAPHPPFVFGPNGGYHHPKGPFGYWDGSDFMEFNTPEAYRDGYMGQATYIGKLTLAMVDKLLSAKGQKPIILIQGDHGSKLRLNQNDLAKTDVTECFENLAAFYVPDDIRAKLYPGITPVNSFRIILGQLYGLKLPLKPDHSWYSPFSHPLEFTDVTDQVVAAGPPKQTATK